MPAAEMVTTSLKMPQIESVTTFVRCRSVNSDEIMQNAKNPGMNISRSAFARPSFSTRIFRPAMTADGVSLNSAMTNKVTNMIGARRKRVANGFEVAGCRRSRICVRAHRKPEKNDAEIARTKPSA